MVTEMIYGIYTKTHNIDFYIKSEDCFHQIEINQLTKDKKYHLKLIIPAEWVVLHSITLPKMSVAKQKQAVIYQLEDSLIKDVDNYHFAILNSKNNITRVITIEHTLLNAILQKIPEHLFITQMVPEMLLLPLYEDKTTILVDEQRLIVLEDQVAFVAQKQDLAALTQDKQTILMGKDQNHTIVCVEQYLLSQLFDSEQGIDLLKGEYKQKIKKATGAKNMYIAMAAILSIFLLFFIVSLGEIIYLKVKNDGINQQVQNNYYQLFPSATSMVAPEERVTQLIRQGDAYGDTAFLQLLAIVSKAVKQDNVITFTEVQYSNQTLTLKVTAPTSEKMDGFIKTLSMYGLKTKEQSSNLSKGKFNAVITLKR